MKTQRDLLNIIWTSKQCSDITDVKYALDQMERLFKIYRDKINFGSQWYTRKNSLEKKFKSLQKKTQ